VCSSDLISFGKLFENGFYVAFSGIRPYFYNIRSFFSP
jgi:hypothetical protein